MSLHHITNSPKKKIEMYLGITVKNRKITHNIEQISVLEKCGSNSLVVLVGTRDNIYETVHVICPACGSSSESSDGCQCGSEDGESKLSMNYLYACIPFVM